MTKAEILGLSDSRIELVEVPEWKTSVHVRTMTGAERDAFEASCMAGKGSNLANIRARLCAVCLCDDQGARLFSDADAEQLGRKSAAALDRIFAAAQKLNRIGAADVEELAKN
jgi:hypothetical protein